MTRRTIITVVVILIVVAVAVNTALVGNVLQTNARRHAACLQRQGLYDGQVLFARFIGEELGASPERIEVGLKRLKAKIGERPTC